MSELKEIVTTFNNGGSGNNEGEGIKGFLFKIVIVFLVLIMISISAAYFMLYRPTQEQLTEGLIDSFDQHALMRYKVFNSRLDFSRKSAENLAGRTGIMNAILDYKAGEIDLDGLSEILQPQYLINTEDVGYLIRAERLIDGNVVGSMIVEGYVYDIPMPDEIDKADRIIDTFCLENENIYYEVIVPIISEDIIIGHDFLIFCCNEQSDIITLQDISSKVISSTMLAELRSNAELIRTSEVGEIINKDNIFYHIGNLTDGYYLATSQNETDLLHNANIIKSRVSVIGIVFFVSLAVIIAVVFILLARKEFIDYESHLSRLSKELHQSKLDPLTNAGVRRAGEDHLKFSFNYYEKTKFSPAIIMFDIDELKNVNDSYGHLAGDIAIKKVVATVADNVRANDRLYRWGGDEFIVIVDGLEQLHAYQFVEKILQAVADAKIEYIGESINPTISLGLTYFNEEDTNYLDAINRVDLAMYKSKVKGNNRGTII